MADQIRDAFRKVKDDMAQLREQLMQLTDEIKSIKRTLIQTDKPTDRQTPPYFHSTQNQTDQTDTKKIDKKYLLESSNNENLIISTGNEGVQTDRQTNRQTDTSNEKFALNEKNTDHLTRIEKVSEILDSLDTLKKELRTQFKRLTEQEMLVFSSIYQLDNEGFAVDYALLAKKTNLSESSIRDYVQKLLKKSIPVAKTKENNKRIVLTIPDEFKRMTSLATIISLRDL